MSKTDPEASFEAFVFDSFVRSFDHAEALYGAVCRMSRKERRQFAKPLFDQQEQWRQVYDNLHGTLSKNVRLSDGNDSFAPEKIYFHERFGWTFERGTTKAYLGKASVCDGIQIQIGMRSYISGNGTLRGASDLTIGNYVNIGSDCYFQTDPDFHPYRYPATLNMKTNPRLIEDEIDFAVDYKDINDAQRGISIGHDVWIARGVRLVHGVRIGNGAVVADGSFVNRDCEPYGIYAGRPARLKGYRFSEEIREELETLKWWLWPPEKIRAHKAFFRTRLADAETCADIKTWPRPGETT